MLKVVINSQLIKRKVIGMAKRPVGVKLFSTDRNSHKIIQAMPFKLPEEKVIQFLKGFSKHYPKFSSELSMEQYYFANIVLDMTRTARLDTKRQINEPIISMEVCKAYIPLWYCDMAFSADVSPFVKKKSEEKGSCHEWIDPNRQILCVGFNCFWSGHTSDGICFLNCPKSLVPFAPELYEDLDIEVVPFTVNPFNNLSDHIPHEFEKRKTGSLKYRQKYAINYAQVLFHAVYPIYWPVYVVEAIGSCKKKESVSLKILIGADSTDLPTFYKWNPLRRGANRLKNNGTWIKFDATENAWEIRSSNDVPVPAVDYLYQPYSRQQTMVRKFEAEQVNWEDDRILSYTDYQSQNKEYLHQLYKVWAKRSMLSRMETMFDNERIKIRGEVINKQEDFQKMKVHELRREIESQLGEDLEKLNQSEPVWYRKYCIL